MGSEEGGRGRTMGREGPGCRAALGNCGWPNGRRLAMGSGGRPGLTATQSEASAPGMPGGLSLGGESEPVPPSSGPQWFLQSLVASCQGAFQEASSV